MDLDNIQRKYGLPAPLPVVQNGKFATRFPLNLEHRGDDVFQFGGKYIGEIENIYDLLYKILTNQEIDASLALPYAIKITEDKLYIRDKTNSEWITIFDITKPNFPKEIELYELIYKAITHQVISEDTSYPGQLKIEENILYVRDKDNLTWTQIGDVTKEFLGATEATQAILEQVNDILTEVQELKTELNRQIATTNETLTTALQAANEAMTSAQSINIRTFNSVEEMKASNTLKVGALVKTQGFYTAGDGGGADYVITNDIGEDEVDEASIITLQKELYAKLLVQNYIDARWFGIYGDGINNDTDNLQKAINYAYKKSKVVDNFFGGLNYKASNLIVLKDGIFLIKNTIELPCNITIKGINAIIISNNENEDENTLFNIRNVAKDNIIVYGNNINTLETLTILTKNSNNKTVAIFLGNTEEESESNNNTSIGVGSSRYKLHNVYLKGFYKTISLHDNTYLNTFSNVEISHSVNAIYTKENIDNAGEKITFIDCCLYENELVINNNSMELNFINTSFDYNKKILDGNYARLFFTKCHFEGRFFLQDTFNAWFKFPINMESFATFRDCTFYIVAGEKINQSEALFANATAIACLNIYDCSVYFNLNKIKTLISTDKNNYFIRLNERLDSAKYPDTIAQYGDTLGFKDTITSINNRPKGLQYSGAEVSLDSGLLNFKITSNAAYITLDVPFTNNRKNMQTKITYEIVSTNGGSITYGYNKGFVDINDTVVMYYGTNSYDTETVQNSVKEYVATINVDMETDNSDQGLSYQGIRFYLKVNSAVNSVIKIKSINVFQL